MAGSSRARSSPVPTTEMLLVSGGQGGGGGNDQQAPPATPRGAVLGSPRSSPTSRAVLNMSNMSNYTYIRSNGEISSSLEGYLLKRGSHISTYIRWNDRYFILRPDEGTLAYYMQRGDVKPKGVIALSQECTVSDVYMAERREKKGDKSGGGDKSGAVSLADENEDSGLSERSGGGGAYSFPASDSERDSGEVGVTELTAREKQPVTKRLASAVYGSSKSSGKSKTKKGREKLYCIKISWLRSGGGGMSVSEKSANEDDIPEIPNINSATSAETQQDFLSARSTATMVPLSPRVPPSPSVASANSDGLRGTTYIRDSVSSGSERSAQQQQHHPSSLPGTPRGGGSISSGSSRRPPSPSILSSIPRPSPGIARSKSYDPDDLTSEVSSTAPVTKPTRISKHRRAASEAVGGGRMEGAGASDSAISYSLPPRYNDGSQRSGGGGGGSLLPPRPPSLSNADGASSSAPDVPLLPSAGSLDGADNSGAESGIAKHYQTQVALQKSQTEEEYQKAMQLMYLSAKRAAYKRNKKRFVQGSKIAAAAAAVTTASVLTAGVGLAVGLVFVGITAAAGGSGAVAEATYKRSKDSTSVVIAAPTLEEAQAWRDAILGAIARQSDGGGAAVAVSRGAPAALSDTDPRSPATSPRGDGIDGIGKGPSKQDEPTGIQYGFQTQWVPIDTSPSLLGIGGGFSSTGGMRIFREEPLICNDTSGTSHNARQMYRQRRSMLAVVGSEGHYACLPLKASLVLPASPLDAFMCLMSHSRIQNPDQVPLLPNSGQRASFRVIETLDDHCDIIHLVHRPLYLFPSWTAPRDYCLFRYWRFEADGTYMICYDSVEHRECPPIPGYVRGSLYGVHTIAPWRRHRRGGARTAGIDDEECLLTHHVQVDPKGWVPKSSSGSSYFPASFMRTLIGGLSSGYVEAFGVSALLCSLDLRDALDNDRFVQVSMDSNRQSRSSWKRSPSISCLGATVAQESSIEQPSISTTDSAEEDDDAVISDYRFVEREVIGPEEISVASAEKKVLSWATDPQPCVTWAWAAPDANSYLTRGKNYLNDRKKYNAGDSVFRLFAVDMVEVDGTIYSGMCAHPKERVQRALKREKQGLPSDFPPYVVAINIAVAGPPWYHMVFYYAVDEMSLIDGTDGTPFSKLANEFFFGDSDGMRDETFKMIPRIVEGNFMVRKAVGSTPAIMGNKLKQHYIRTDRYFELLLDTGSSSVAAGVIRLVLGYSKTVVVDMAFLLEGKDESTLPEKIFGCVRLKHYVFGKELTRFVEQWER